jgi:hypothetical protein
VIRGEDPYVAVLNGDDRTAAKGVISAFVSDDDDGTVCIAIAGEGSGRRGEGCRDESDERKNPARDHGSLVGMPDRAPKRLNTNVRWRIRSSQL